MKSFFGQFNGLKHTIALAYIAVFTAYATDPTVQTALNALGSTLYHALPHWAALLVTGLLLPLLSFYSKGLKKPEGALSPSQLAKPAAALVIAAAMFLGMSCPAQTTTAPATTAATATPAGELTNIYGVGISYNPSASPSIAGTALQAHGIGNTGTYEFTTLDALPNTSKPFTVTTNVGVGVAQKLLTLGSVPIFGTTATGVAWSGSNAGWQYNFGAAALIGIRKDKNYFIMPTARVLKSTINGGYSPIVGVEFVFGN